MKKRYIIGIIIVIAIVGGIATWLNFNKAYVDNDPLRHIPSDASAVIRVNGIDNYGLTLLSTDYCSDISKIGFASLLDSVIIELDTILAHCDIQEPQLHEREIIISLHGTLTDKMPSSIFAFSLKNHLEGYNIKSTLSENPIYQFADTSINNSTIQTFTTASKSRKYLIEHDGSMYISDNAALLQTLIQKEASSISNDICFSTLSRTASSTTPLALFINIAKIPIAQTSQQGDWIELDFEFNKKDIVANGFIASSKATIATTIATQETKRLTIDDYIPSIAATFISYAAGPRGLTNESFIEYLNANDTADEYRKSQAKYLEETGEDIEDQMGQLFSSDIALFSLSDNIADTLSTCLIVEAENGTIAQALLNSIIGSLHAIEMPQQIDELAPTPQIKIPVYEAFTENDYLFMLEKMFPYTPRHFYLRYENTILIANTIETLKQTLYENMLSRTFGSDADYRNFRASFPDDYVFFYFSNGSSIKGQVAEMMKCQLTQEQTRALTNFYGFGIQITSLNEMPYATIALHHEPSRIDMPPTAWQSRFTNRLIGRPWMVKNHNTQEHEYIVQDTANNIHLINSKGLELWTHKINGQIIGDVHQIDYYNNRKLQYLFCTKNSIHLIDRNGNNTADFPIHLANDAVSGVTYIDYDDPKNFRLFVADSDRRITLYDRTCQRIQGWEMLPTEGLVRNEIQHFVSNNKDYLVMTDEYHCYITDRRGNERVSVPTLAPNKQSAIGLLQPNTEHASFVLLTANSKLAIIDIATGKIREVTLPDIGTRPCRMIQLKKTKQFAIISAKRIVVVDENGAIASSNQIDLSSIDWVEALADDKIAIWDKDDHLGYIFSPQGEKIDGFPIPTWSPFTIATEGNVNNIVAIGKDGELNCFIK